MFFSSCLVNVVGDKNNGVSSLKENFSNLSKIHVPTIDFGWSIQTKIELQYMMLEAQQVTKILFSTFYPFLQQVDERCSFSSLPFFLPSAKCKDVVDTCGSE